MFVAKRQFPSEAIDQPSLVLIWVAGSDWRERVPAVKPIFDSAVY